MNIAYYITPHGFGHGVRSCAICNRLSPETSVIFRTALPRAFFEQEVMRPFLYAPQAFDCGCVQTDGVTVDVEKTIAAYSSIAAKNAAGLDAEAAWCREHRIDGIVADIPPFAFEVADACGIPSVAVTNFTWYDIYEEYGTRHPAFLPLLEKIKAHYGAADLLLALEPALPMTYFKRRKSVGIVGRSGGTIRARLIKAFGLSSSKRLGLIYTGTFGMDAMDWSRLARFEDWEFLGLYPLPGNPPNFHMVAKRNFSYQDIIASVDCVISKMGYGVFAECALNGVPLIYLPRVEFAEYPVLDAAMSKRGGGYRLSQEDFYELSWDGALREVITRPRPAPEPSDDGAERCAREIERVIGERRR
jgi:L-arabinokinase